VPPLVLDRPALIPPQLLEPERPETILLRLAEVELLDPPSQRPIVMQPPLGRDDHTRPDEITAGLRTSPGVPRTGHLDIEPGFEDARSDPHPRGHVPERSVKAMPEETVAAPQRRMAAR